MFQMINFPPNETVQIDPEVWKACAGRSSRASIKQVPEVGTNVYYFPEGHAEQYDLHPVIAPFDRPMVPCRVLNVRYFADRANDDLFAAIVLEPTGSHFGGAPPALSLVVFGGGESLSDGAQLEGLLIDYETKVLSQTDANNIHGKWVIVPKECAMSILPKLEEHSPAQMLTMSDLQGMNWEFRHVYRGSPPQHILTTGWRRFCDTKRLVAGDILVLMKDILNGELHIGTRRHGADMNRRRSLHLGAGEGIGNFQGFVEEAARQAAQGLPFEVVLYPGSGFTDFVVQKGLVDRSLELRWAVGVPVKMNVAALDCSKPRWISGHVSNVMIPQEGGQWRGSPWKMLQITWDQPEPELRPNVERLSPWQVEKLEEGPLILDDFARP